MVDSGDSWQLIGMYFESCCRVLLQGQDVRVTKNVEPWTVVGGNPAKVIKKRVLREAVANPGG